MKAFLDKAGVTPTEVAAGTGLSTDTVYRFLRGESVTRRTVRTLTEFVASKVSPPEAKRSTG